MKHSLPQLDSLKAFESAARHLSFSLAANELCITKGAISYQIKKLEDEIQCSLFKRSVRQVYLTDAGQGLFQTTKQLFQELDVAFSKLQDVKQQTKISLATTTYVAARWLSSRISRFNNKYPTIHIMLQHAVNSDDFNLDDADLTILWGPCLGQLDKHRFAEIPMPMYPVISPQLLKNHYSNTTMKLNIETLTQKPFRNIPLLCEDRKLDTWHEWFTHNNTRNKTKELSNPRRVISDANVRVQAAIDGQGLILADDLMSNELNNGLLVAPFTQQLTGYGYAFYASSVRFYNDNALILKDWITNNA